MGIQSNINSGISTLSYILSLGSKFKNQDNKISENERNIDENATDIADTKADIHATDEEGNRVINKNIVKKPFDPFDKYIAEFKSKLSADEIALLDAQESRKAGSTRNLVDNYIRGRVRHERNTQFFRNKAEELMTNATQEDLDDPKFMERIKRYENWGTAPYRTQSDFFAEADRKKLFDSPEEREQRVNEAIRKRNAELAEEAKRDNATKITSNRLKMDVENKMKQETLKEERRNILQSMNADLNNTPRGDM